MAGCCTSCAVRVKSGQLRQPEALGISAELKSKVRIVTFIWNWITIPFYLQVSCSDHE